MISCLDLLRGAFGYGIIGGYVSYELAKQPRILVGTEYVKHLMVMIKELSGEHAFLVLDPVVAQSDYMKRISVNLPSTTFVMPAGEPVVATVNAAADLARLQPKTVVIGIGGGSTLDTAKQVAGLIVADKPLEHYLLCANPWYGCRPMIAIPTTAGTGSEVTRTAMVNHQGRKMWTWGDVLLPDVVILDPVAALSMPDRITISSGLDAFVRAVEAATSQHRNIISRGLCFQAIDLVNRNLPLVIDEPHNLEARQAMQEAAMLAGMAVDNCGTGVAHGMGHVLSALYHLPHGVAVSLALQASLDWNIEWGEAPYQEISKIFGTYVKGMPITFTTFLQKVGFANMISPDFDMQAEDIANRMVLPENLPMLNNNWRPVNEKDRLELANRVVKVWNSYKAKPYNPYAN